MSKPKDVYRASDHAVVHRLMELFGVVVNIGDDHVFDDKTLRYLVRDIVACSEREGKTPGTLNLPSPAAVSRVETGPVAFGRDWPGVFIRGDNAMWYSMNLRFVKTDQFLVSKCVEDLRELLASCQVR